MSLGRYLIGVAALLCVLGSLGVGAAAARRHFLPQLSGADACLAEIVAGCALLVGIMEVLGTVGLFRLIPIVVASIAVGSGLRLGVMSRSGRRALHPRAARRRVGVADGAVIVVAMAGVVVVLVLWMRRSFQSFEHGITGADSIGYHLPHAAFYAQTGRTGAIPYTDFDYLTGLYPATSELFHALGIVLMGDDVLSPAINVIWLGFTLLAAWCIGSLRRVGGTSMLAAALVMATPMMVGSNAGTADSDLLGVFLVTAALALWMRTADTLTTDRRAHRAGSITAAVAAGLALSVKLNLLGPVGALTLVAIAFTPKGWRRSAGGWWIGGLLLAGGYWYARNLIAVGNPLPWFSFGVLPTPRPPPLQHGNNYSLADYVTYPRILRDWLIPALKLNLGSWWPALVATAAIGPLACLFPRRDRVIIAAALIALASLVTYPLTPLSACGPWGHPYCLRLNMRYGASALTSALVVTPLALPLRSRVGRFATSAGLVTLFVVTVALRRPWPRHYSTEEVAGAAIVVFVAAAIVVLGPRFLIALQRPLARAIAATLAVSLVLAGVAAGASGTAYYLGHRYTDNFGPSGISQVWRWARRLHHARIALAGTLGWYFGYPLWGVDDSNHVAYMGRRGPHGSFRPITSCRAWRTALNRGHYQYVVTTASRIFFTTELVQSRQVDWTRSDPAARLVLSPTRAIHVFRLTGPLHPGHCGHQSHGGFDGPDRLVIAAAPSLHRTVRGSGRFAALRSGARAGMRALNRYAPERLPIHFAKARSRANT
ncbi:MAG TPA: hypothetical protein VJ741_11725, partial [Solirubrobacteraceae bacterium]|nr:hypothetical protein [Solirubrobacteraceae bacterium]